MHKLSANPLNYFSGNIYCKDANGVIIWHNNSVVEELKPKIGIDNLVGKTIYDFLKQQSADQCRKDDILVLKNAAKDAVRVKLEKLSLINSAIDNYLTFTNPLVSTAGNPVGVMISTINTKKLHAKEFMKKKSSNEYIDLLKEILVIINLMQLTDDNFSKKELLSESKDVAKRLLLDSGLYECINQQLLSNFGNVTVKI